MPKLPRNPLKRKEEPKPEPRADVHQDIQFLAEAIKGSNEQTYPSGDVETGVEKRQLDEYDTSWILKTLFDPTLKQLPSATNTPKSQFNVITIGETFDEVVRQGENRKESIFSIYIHKRDVRAPSIDGEYRRDLVGVFDSKIQTERSLGAGETVY